MSSDSAVSLEFLACGNGSLRGLALGFGASGIGKGSCQDSCLDRHFNQKGFGFRVKGSGAWRMDCLRFLGFGLRV